MKAFCQSILEKKMYYGPLLGWAYVMGKDIVYSRNLGYVSPAGMTFVGENCDFIMVGTDGLEAIKALCKDFGLEVEQSVPKLEWCGGSRVSSVHNENSRNSKGP